MMKADSFNPKKVFTVFVFAICSIVANAQALKFAFVTDTHIGNHTGAEDLRRTVADINGNSDLQFVVVNGDITEFGSDEELRLAHRILDSLNKPWYVIAGNHDSNWSESGSNTFRKVFGSETFAFTAGGYQFVATSSGPNMRMGPGQIPRENIVWLDSVLTNMKDPDMPVIYLNHYPQDSSLNNWYEAIDRVKKRNVQLVICGHGHSNRRYDIEGIPGIMGRSNLRAKDSIGGYNVVTIENGTAVFEERTPVTGSQRKWMELPMSNHYFNKDTTRYFRPSYAVNDKYPQVEVNWTYQDDSDVGAGTAAGKGLIVATNTSGHIYALDERTGKRKWLFKTKGKIYSTPGISGRFVVAGSSDQHIYCLDLLQGKLVWKVAAQKPVLGAPLIHKNKVYIGSSDGRFRAIDLKSGKVVWDFDQVKGFVVTRPLFYEGKVFFGCWANDFYALDAKTGALVWKWNNGATNRMFSPAACYPVAANGKVFIVAPDRYMTAFEATSGKVVWRKQMKDARVRESVGISEDQSLVYVKTMDGNLLGISTRQDSLQVDWTSEMQLPYELNPAAIVESNGVVFVPSHSGLAIAVDRRSGKVLWKHKSSNCLLNPLLPVKGNRAILSSMDGRIVSLKYK